ncbi:hypothetical protein ASE75_13785 [Sphingomonas sp. Leaf17]|nr:hypothetical protein ASE75_13785 [Sphingomonas sp. Leaf17]
MSTAEAVVALMEEVARATLAGRMLGDRVCLAILDLLTIVVVRLGLEGLISLPSRLMIVFISSRTVANKRELI